MNVETKPRRRVLIGGAAAVAMTIVVSAAAAAGRRGSVAASPTSPASAAPGAPGAPRTITWDDLMPRGWDPTRSFRDVDPRSIGEGSAADDALMRRIREVWDRAPTRPEMNGAVVRLPGYVVPLDQDEGGRLLEFLLVTYFGACIHSPPPPANQIVLVTMARPEKWRTMQAVWVSGRLGVSSRDTELGVSGYSLRAERVEAYQPGSR